MGMGPLPGCIFGGFSFRDICNANVERISLILCIIKRREVTIDHCKTKSYEFMNQEKRSDNISL